MPGTVLWYDTLVAAAVPITSGVTVTAGDLVGITSNAAVLGDNTTGPQKACGIAVFNDDYSGAVSRLGTASNSPTVNIYRRAKIEVSSSQINGTPTVGIPVYLHTGGGFTITQPSTNAMLMQAVGIVSQTYVRGGTTYYVITLDVPPDILKFQTAGNSSVGYV